MSQRCSTSGSVFTLSFMVPCGYSPLPSIHPANVCESHSRKMGSPRLQKPGVQTCDLLLDKYSGDTVLPGEMAEGFP